MSHPFSNHDHQRHSPAEVAAIIGTTRYCCPKCAEKRIKVNAFSKPTFPEGSTATVMECESCKCKWEVAYSLIYSMCILNEDEEHTKGS